MRGKDDQRGQILHDHRITPAYAGKSPFEVRVILLREDHPRLCGEKTKAARRRLMGTGSPPPMRGKGYTDKSLTAMDRITPAYAGKSHFATQPEKYAWDHPRLCGEKPLSVSYSHHVPGSPPPMRGKVPRVYFSQTVYRITPAYAGKREEAKNYLRVEQDHPRLCGEKCGKAVGVHQGVGSPPPMRGKVFFFDSQHLRIRITPAYAGKRILRF